MNTPETLVQNFIEDYYLWNKHAFEAAEKLRADELAELSAAGITEPFRPDQPNKAKEYMGIKEKYSAGMLNLLPKINNEYQKIIDKYCRPNYKHLSTAFGNDSSHDPNYETIIVVNTENDRSIIKTERIEQLTVDSTYASHFEFHLTYENKRWYLEQIYYIDEEGRYESL